MSSESTTAPAVLIVRSPSCRVSATPAGTPVLLPLGLTAPGTVTAPPVTGGAVTVPGTVKPSGSNTGVPAGVALTRHDGDLTISTAGAVVDSLDIYGFVKINAPGVVIKNTRIRGTATTIQRALVTSNSAGASVTIQDSELYASSPSPYIDGVRGFNITVQRSNIHHVIDTFHLTGGNVRIESSWLHDNVHYASDPLQGGGASHDDSIQIQAGSNIRILGNTIEGATNSGIQFTQDSGIVSDVQVVKNWADGGGCTINLAEKGRGPFAGIVITDNVFGRDTKHYNCAIISPTTTKITAARNVFTDGTVAAVQKG